jgi:hypothetical protein
VEPSPLLWNVGLLSPVIFLFQTLFSCNVGELRCTEQHVAALAQPAVSQLAAASTGIDDALAARLAGVAKLESVSIPGNPLTDKDLAEFKKLKGLKNLDVGATQVTAAGVADLQQALPDCRIQSDR